MTARPTERGAVTVEFVLLLPVLLLIVGAVVAGSRVWLARSAVQQLASSAARQASLSRSASDAVSSATRLVRDDSERQGLSCADGVRVQLDAAGFGVPVGRPAEVGATVRCVVPLADLLVPGVPGTITVSATARSTLDRFRERE